MRNISIDSFKNEIVKTNQLPFNKLNFILFISLLVIYYESNNQNNITKFISLKLI